MSTHTPFSHIVVALDGSNDAELALRPAMEIARAFGSTLVLVRAADERSVPQAQPSIGVRAGPSITPDLGAMGAMPVTASLAGVEQNTPTGGQLVEDSDARGYLHILAEDLRRQGFIVVDDIYPGDPAEAIIEQSRIHNADLIVVTSANQGGLEKLFFGSITDRILRDAPCPVMLIRRK